MVTNSKPPVKYDIKTINTLSDYIVKLLCTPIPEGRNAIDIFDIKEILDMALFKFLSKISNQEIKCQEMYKLYGDETTQQFVNFCEKHLQNFKVTE